MRERDIEKHLVKRVKALGGMCPKMVSPGMRGFPDRMVILPDSLVKVMAIVFLVEVKSSEGRLSKLQERVREKLTSYGMFVRVVRSKDEVDALFDL